MPDTPTRGEGPTLAAAAAVGVTVALAATAVALLAAPPSSGRAARPAGAPDRGAAAAPSAPPPVRILVDAVGLDARVSPVGVTGEGALAVPDDSGTAGWYRFGPAPGSPSGSAVLVGHAATATGAPGGFAALSDVRPGDRVEVRRAGADPVVHRVVSRTTVPEARLSPAVFSPTGAPVLTLAACGPPLVPDRGGCLSKLLVTARPVER
ncbi:class F sortase [Streptomyces sp. NPDC048002]|uniref:class F sortase n=1 Tax=unclassified Streptomyces TaxID=2593676 RepID=UPI003403967C